MPESHSRVTVYAALAALAAVLIRLPGLAQPIGPDQGILISIAKGIVNGLTPYRDVWEMASPGIFYTFALFVKILGVHMWVPGVADMAACALSSCLLVILGTRLWNSRAGLLAGLFFAVFSCTNSLSVTAAGTPAFGTYWILAQRETFMTPFIILAILLHIIILERRRLVLLIPYGAAWGMAFLYKFPIGLLIFFAGIHLYYHLCWKSGPWPKRIVQFLLVNALMAVGFIAIQSPFYAAVIAGGGGPDMNDAMFGYVKEIYSESHNTLFGTIKLMLERTVLVMRDGLMMWALAVAGIVMMRPGFGGRDSGAGSRVSSEGFVVAMWLVISFLVVVAHREFHGYHYLLLIPPAALLAGRAFVQLVSNGDQTPGQRLWSVEPALVLLLLGFVLNGVIFTANNYKYVTKSAKYVKALSSSGPNSPERLDAEGKYFQYFTEWPEHDYSFTGSNEALRYIEAHSQPGDTFFVYGGIESFMYYLSDRPCPSRFNYSWHLFRTSRMHSPRAKAYRDEILRTLSEEPPRYLLIIGQPEQYEQFPDHIAFIRGNYRLIQEFTDERFLFEYAPSRSGP